MTKAHVECMCGHEFTYEGMDTDTCYCPECSMELELIRFGEGVTVYGEPIEDFRERLGEKRDGIEMPNFTGKRVSELKDELGDV